MIKEIISSKRSSLLRKNDSEELMISINYNEFQKFFIINGGSLITEENPNQNLTIKPKNYYMVINNGDNSIELKYNKDISRHKII
ncbi:MAG: hypothetical protein ACW96X_11750, partial [Promethearchaeota archaeon]